MLWVFRRFPGGKKHFSRRCIYHFGSYESDRALLYTVSSPLLDYTFRRRGCRLDTVPSKKARPYSAYPYIHVAYYSFFGVKRRFFILSDRQISTEDRNRANLLGGTMEVLKIRYSERNYQRMMKMLPRRQKSQLKIAHDTILVIEEGGR